MMIMPLMLGKKFPKHFRTPQLKKEASRRKRLQRSSKCNMSKAEFERVVREIDGEVKKVFRWGTEAIEALPYGSEHNLYELLKK